jgi:membrane fusion protein, copper/silver efflux system
MANHDDPPVKSSKAHRIWTVVRILQVRLRFIVLMVLVGIIAGNWENIMNHYDRWRRPAAVAVGEQPQEIEYYCAMHPNIIRSEPGNCPICGMPLAKRAKTAHGAELPAGVLAQVQLTPLKVEMGRIGVSPVEYRLLSREIRTVGIADYDETRRAFISARIKGRIDTLMVNYVGQQVKKGDPLASIYSPDLLVAQEELLLAVRGLEQQKGKPTEESARSLVDSARQKLSLWGITQDQIEEIIRRGKSETHLTLYSPMTGIVTEKKVLEGRYVNEGDDLYTIADLSQVWLQAKVFEDEIKGVQVGTAVEVTSTAYPGEIFAGRIGFVAYLVDPATRTVSARVEVLNPEYKLKPGMYVQAIIRLPLGAVTEPSAVAPPKNDDRYVTGYYCPIYPGSTLRPGSNLSH